MPQNRESFESRILAFFQSGDLAAAQLLLGLATKAVKDRLPKKGSTPGAPLTGPGAPKMRRAPTRQTAATEPQPAVPDPPASQALPAPETGTAYSAPRS